MNHPDAPLDNEELRLLRDIESGVWRDNPLNEEETQAYQNNAAYTMALQEKKSATIVLTTGELAFLRARARKLETGYEQIVQALVRNYVTGKISLEI